MRKSQSFEERILGIPGLVHELESRRYFQRKDGNADGLHCMFENAMNPSGKIVLFFGTVLPDSFSVSILLYPRVLEEYFIRLDLFGPILDADRTQPFVALSIDLLWLRWNAMAVPPVDPFHYEISGSIGVSNFITDLDELGKPFIDAMANAESLAETLVALRSYPTAVTFGGGPTSVDPFTFAAILYLSAGNFSKARAAVELGRSAYDFGETSIRWQQTRHMDFDGKATKLLRYIEEGEKSG